MPTIREIIASQTQFLEQQGIEAPRLNVELLLAKNLKTERMQLYLLQEQQVENSILNSLQQQLQNRAKGIPLQHLLGTVEFCGHSFFTDNRALIPRPETETLVEQCLQLSLPKSAKVLDLATGSGVIGISLALAKPEWKITLSDIDRQALALAQKNLQHHNLGARLQLVQSDLFSNLVQQEKFDLIVTNLPYIPSAEIAHLAPEVQHDPLRALDGGIDGFVLIKKVIQQLQSRLNPQGFAAFEVGYNQGTSTLQLLKEAGFSTQGIWTDLEGVSRFPWAKHLEQE